MIFIITHFINVVIEAAETSFNVQIFTFNDCVHNLSKLSKKCPSKGVIFTIQNSHDTLHGREVLSILILYHEQLKKYKTVEGIRESPLTLIISFT